jgi:RHS repeat-associated protein
MTAAPGSIEHVYRIYAGSGEIAQVQRVEQNGTISTDKTLFLGADALGSTNLIADNTGHGMVLQRFSPYGRSEQPDTSTGVTTGFTGHEDEASLGLVNMKGRLYDPKLGRFITPDPIVQLPYWSQSLNRYSYVWNNPLRWADPSGFEADGDGAGDIEQEQELAQEAPNVSVAESESNVDNGWDPNLPAQQEGRVQSIFGGDRPDRTYPAEPPPSPETLAALAAMNPTFPQCEGPPPVDVTEIPTPPSEASDFSAAPGTGGMSIAAPRTEYPWDALAPAPQPPRSTTNPDKVAMAKVLQASGMQVPIPRLVMPLGPVAPGYVDFGFSAAYHGRAYTGGAFMSGTGFTPYGGGGLSTPGVALSLSFSNQSVSPGMIGWQAQTSALLPFGPLGVGFVHAWGADAKGSPFVEWGIAAGFPPGISYSFTGYQAGRERGWLELH